MAESIRTLRHERGNESFVLLFGDDSFMSAVWLGRYAPLAGILCTNVAASCMSLCISLQGK